MAPGSSSESSQSRPPIALEQPARDVETEPGAFPALGIRAALEAAEDPRPVGGRDPGTLVR